MVKTFQVFETVSKEYFVEAETFDEAVDKIMDKKVQATSVETIDWIEADCHNGEYWEKEAV